MAVILLYWLAINIVGFFLFGFDKLKAVRKERRVPEKRLFLIAALGGAAGAWIGMRKFRHKTKHASFTFGIPALLLLNIVCVSLLIKTFG
ncbi:DUF1294 domain-containing protein [Paenibacillus hemerocallicola]|jgi:uncharacterized membrane protein YsdA (DUF1294 family)|uniref:DUF1294 domain-containing protein n=1 Tax=Paenibacillus hemerocallicola TaxID=1172614 RepID=A0A5C4T937_9BACL|nr:DUF1294 domain-containing protein [Paenibacillus hemerocallicola]TNJ65588.1 DUF1294 domain-containing protein [Paenibacillus hemerocallicola]